MALKWKFKTYSPFQGYSDNDLLCKDTVLYLEESSHTKGILFWIFRCSGILHNVIGQKNLISQKHYFCKCLGYNWEFLVEKKFSKWKECYGKWCFNAGLNTFMSFLKLLVIDGGLLSNFISLSDIQWGQHAAYVDHINVLCFYCSVCLTSPCCPQWMPTGRARICRCPCPPLHKAFMVAAHNAVFLAD